MGDTALLGIIGGSGLYRIEGLEDLEEREVETPFGPPSDAFLLGRIGEQRLAFLPRHGVGHRIMPSELNFRANIHAMKQLGADAIISISAVGSLREDVEPGHLVVPDQFIDRTRGRISTFFGGGVVGHASLADPFCAPLSRMLAQAARDAGAVVHEGATYVCMEGPMFSTRAESRMYRAWGGDIIGMTNLQEAKLAREAEICFATLALATDYDAWREDGGAVEVEDILAILAANAELANRSVGLCAQRLEGLDRACACRRALDGAVITQPDAIPVQKRRELDLIIGRVLSDGNRSSD